MHYHVAPEKTQHYLKVNWFTEALLRARSISAVGFQNNNGNIVCAMKRRKQTTYSLAGRLLSYEVPAPVGEDELLRIDATVRRENLFTHGSSTAIVASMSCLAPINYITRLGSCPLQNLESDLGIWTIQGGPAGV